MKKIEVLEYLDINGKLYPRHVRTTYIDQERPPVLSKSLENYDIAENIFSDEKLKTLQLGK